jgi:hypothetical protein
MYDLYNINMAAVIATQKRFSLLENMDIDMSGLRYDKKNSTNHEEGKLALSF